MNGLINVLRNYTRQKAIADRVLLDLTPAAQDVGIDVPVVFIPYVYKQFVHDPAKGDFEKQAARLWNILFMLRLAIRDNPESGSTLYFGVPFEDYGRPGDPTDVFFKAHWGSDPDGTKYLAVMEDPEE